MAKIIPPEGIKGIILSRAMIRLQDITEEEFRRLLLAKLIRPSSLEDVHGTHHQRPLYRHPRTGQYYTTVK